MHYRLTAALLLTAITLTAGCDKKDPAAPATSTGAGTATPSSGSHALAPALPESLFLAAAPEGAKDVKAAKAGAKQGDQVVLVGRIGGREEPFVAHRAIFQLVDPAMPACSDNAADTCKTPWDYCCEDPADVSASSATIQVVDPSGAPLKIDLKDAHGLKPLSRIIVVGTVASADAGNIVVNATGIYVGG
ncbi:MAG: hypothetical protein H7Y88_00605 [Phycisphaerales bacterium]|nr:hypothetical protein [Phycisphaerales bacterium]